MSQDREIRSFTFVPTQTEVRHELSKQKYGRIAHSSVEILLTSFLLLITPLQLSAAPLAPYTTDTDGLSVRCKGQVEAETSSSQEQQRDDCTPAWTEELQKEYQDHDTTPWWEDFHLGPQSLSEQELRFLYRPGERRPLWGY